MPMIPSSKMLTEILDLVSAAEPSHCPSDRFWYISDWLVQSSVERECSDTLPDLVKATKASVQQSAQSGWQTSFPLSLVLLYEWWLVSAAFVIDLQTWDQTSAAIGSQAGLWHIGISASRHHTLWCQSWGHRMRHQLHWPAAIMLN